MTVQHMESFQLREHPIKEIFTRIPDESQDIKPGNSFRGYLALFVMPRLVPAPRRQVRTALDFTNAKHDRGFLEIVPARGNDAPTCRYGDSMRSQLHLADEFFRQPVFPGVVEAVEIAPIEREPDGRFRSECTGRQIRARNLAIPRSDFPTQHHRGSR